MSPGIYCPGYGSYETHYSPVLRLDGFISGSCCSPEVHEEILPSDTFRKQQRPNTLEIYTHMIK